VNEAAPSEDIYFDASDKKTPSENFSNFTNASITESAVEHVAAVTVISEKTNETKSEEKPAPTMPSVNEVAPSDFSNLTNAPVTESEDNPATACHCHT
jgi:hypothetical protein